MIMNAARIVAAERQRDTTPTKNIGRAAIIELIKDPEMAPLLERWGELAGDPTGESDGPANPPTG